MSTSSAAEEPLRYACNRCHNLKLRCPRSSESSKTGADEPCSRCAKVGAPCIVGKRGKVGRPAKRRACLPPTPPEAADAIYWELVSDAPSVKPTSSTTVAFDSSDDINIDPALSMSDPDARCDPDSMIVASHGSNPFGDASMSARCNSPASLNGREGSTENDDSSHAASSWTSHSSMGGFAGQENSLYDSFVQDAGMFGYADITPTMLNFNPGSLDNFFRTVETGLAGLDEASHEAVFGAQPLTNKSEPAHAALSNTNVTSTQSHASANTTTTNTPSESCLRECLFKLSDLGNRMLRSSMESERLPSSSSSASGNMMDMSEDGASSGHQILRDAVDFSGELIDTARQGLPRFFDAAAGSASLSQDKSFPSTESWADIASASASSVPLAPPSIPESALIFQLIGCYTQLLYNFEVAIDCLYMEHTTAKDQSPSNINSMLKASLSVHTFTYLLGQLHKAFAVCELNTYGAEYAKTTTTTTTAAAGLASPCSSNGDARGSMLSKNLSDGLLGRAIMQIHEREETLMRKAEYLKRLTSQ
ncbi:hypothetical protein BD289DRAFT_483259 [Coniella lustricola]|uniref:Zn(2)-C6 fungal-type domain-containing protein n=1 Tax=Coniella lustricola TaxID=2025994 RepID=A0A2T3A644_9PEZI|nr:hypothetical protein BD289DRAFT_483259 [Coniella lustricola]